MTLAAAEENGKARPALKVVEVKGHPDRGKRLTDEEVAIGARIRTIRIQKGLTQQSLAAEVGISYQEIFKKEHGICRVSCGQIAKIAEALDTPIAAFFSDDDDDALLLKRDRWALEFYAVTKKLTRSQKRVINMLVRELTKDAA